MSSLRIKTTRNVRASRGKNSYRNCKYWSHRDDSSMSKEWRSVNTFFSPRIFNSTTGLQGFLGHSSSETSSLKLTAVCRDFVGEPAGRKMCCSLSDMTGQATAPALTINDTHRRHHEIICYLCHQHGGLLHDKASQLQWLEHPGCCRHTSISGIENKADNVWTTNRRGGGRSSKA